MTQVNALERIAREIRQAKGIPQRKRAGCQDVLAEVLRINPSKVVAGSIGEWPKATDLYFEWEEIANGVRTRYSRTYRLAAEDSTEVEW